MIARFPIIVGPTAGGKSALALGVVEAARAAGVDAEVISADAFAVYREMDIGTAKPSPEERARAPHHLIDVADPTETFTVHDWLAGAEPIIEQLRERGALPIVVGGTHLYAKALLEGMFEGPPPDEAVRARLQAIPQPERRARLARIDPAAAERIHPNDERRTVRALEVFEQTGTPITELQRQWDAEPRADILLAVLDWEPEAINRRINSRVRAMVERGLVAEAHDLWTRERLGPTAREALGYKQLVAYFEGRLTLDEAVERIKIETRRFAKQQRTWLRRLRVFPGSMVIAGPDADRSEIAQALVNQCFRGANGGV